MSKEKTKFKALIDTIEVSTDINNLKDFKSISDDRFEHIDIITDSLATYNKYGSAVAAIPCVEAIFKSTNSQSSEVSIPRNELFRTQTPHTYSFSKLLWAHEEAEKRKIENTAATCVLMNLLGEEIYFSLGSEKNLKITTLDDLDIFKALIKEEKHV